MKYLLVLSFLILGYCSYSQTDSTTIKLEQYREMFSKGLITAQEYEGLKQRLLGLSISPTQSNGVYRLDTTAVNKLGERYKGRIVAGSVFLTIGVAAAIGNTAWGLNRPPTLNHYSPRDDAFRQKKAGLAVVGLISAGCGVAGIILIATGARDQRLYISNGGKITVWVTPANLSLTCMF